MQHRRPVAQQQSAHGVQSDTDACQSFGAVLMRCAMRHRNATANQCVMAIILAQDCAEVMIVVSRQPDMHVTCQSDHGGVHIYCSARKLKQRGRFTAHG